jgi:hypothetical protein
VRADAVATPIALSATHAAHTARPARWSALLLAGVAAAAALALAVGDPAVLLERDRELGTLLRGMAAIKALLVAVAVAAVVWRLRQPVSVRLALGYLAGVWAMTAATAAIWQLTAIGAAAALFHAGEVAVLVLAWRDGLWARAGRRR